MTSILLNILIIVGIAFMLASMYAVINFIRKNIENKYVDELLDVVTSTVDELSQTYVKNLKESGNFTSEEQKKVLQEAIDRILYNLSVESKRYFERNTKDLVKYLTTQIESYLWRTSDNTAN